MVKKDEAIVNYVDNDKPMMKKTMKKVSEDLLKRDSTKIVKIKVFRRWSFMID